MEIAIKDLDLYISDGNYSSKYPRSEEFVGEGIPFIRGNNMIDGDIDDSEMYYITPEKHEILKKGHVKSGDVLITTRGNIGQVAIVPERHEDSNINAQIVLLRADPDKIYNRYLLWVLQSRKACEQYESLQTGTALKQLPVGKLEQVKIPINDLKQQHFIADKLDKTYRIIKERNRELKLLDELIKARFVELFGDPVENPKGYRVDTLQALIDTGEITYHLDGNHGGDYPRSEEFVSEGVPYIGANCISNGEIDFLLAKYLTVERAGKLRKGIAQNEDVLFAHNATVGPTVVLHTTEPKVILSTSLTAYRCNKERILPEYLATYMKSDGFVMQYSSEMKQTTRNQVPITAQKKYLFLIPPIEEQKAFSQFVKQVDKSKVAVEKALDETQTLFDSLMQDYFG